MEVMIVFQAATAYAAPIGNQLHDWLFMGGLLVAFTIPSVVAGIRHRIWRRQVMSAFR